MSLAAPPSEMIHRFLPVYSYFLPRAAAVLSVYPGAVVTSWWRSELRNMQAGGAPMSQHLLGFAADYAHADRRQHVGMASIARSFGLIAVDEGDHVHVQTFPAGALPSELFPGTIGV